MKKIPNPGSKAAIKAGCLCPVMDNAHGKGCGQYRGNTLFWTTAECPIHGVRKDEMIKIDKKIPLPTDLGHKGPARKYPVLEMKKGDSFLVATNPQRQAAIMAAKRNFVTVASRQVDGGYRVWRIA